MEDADSPQQTNPEGPIAAPAPAAAKRSGTNNNNNSATAKAKQALQALKNNPVRVVGGLGALFVATALLVGVFSSHVMHRDHKAMVGLLVAGMCFLLLGLHMYHRRRGRGGGGGGGGVSSPSA